MVQIEGSITLSLNNNNNNNIIINGPARAAQMYLGGNHDKEEQLVSECIPFLPFRPGPVPPTSIIIIIS